MKRSVVITGMGAITPLAFGVEESWKACCEGKSGISRIKKFDPSPFRTQIAGEVKDFDPTPYIEPKEVRRLDPFSQYALVAAQLAVEDAGLSFDENLKRRTGVIIGTGFGGIWTFDKNFKIYMEKGPNRLSPFFVPMMIANIATGLVAIKFGIKGPSSCTVTACAASSHAIGDAVKVIERGQADVMIAGGTEASIIGLTVGGFDVMKATSTRNEEPEKASRPFDKDRDGFVPAEGAGMVVLEALDRVLDRGGKIYAEIIGYGLSNDAFHITAPDPEGQGARLCMEMALEDAGMSTDEIDYINAHGTSTSLNDALETKAIRTLFGKKAYEIPVSSTKSMTGHLLGAAGCIESIFTCLALRDGILPPTINYTTPDPECDLDYIPNAARKSPIRTALSNSFGFGGTNASLVFRKFGKN
jgi:3-oxoacyl-[acyl-carrier-protein] synthase II